MDTFEADLAACRCMLRAGSRSFHAASLLLPRDVRRPATALYAFCRVADDLIDAGGTAPALAKLRRRLDAAYAGRPMPEPADRALAHIIARHRIPRLLLDHLLEGFAWDAEGRRYDDLAALHEYAARVAGTVGAMMAMLMGVRDPGAVSRACDLGIAMQLSNIARDVGEDARAGRLYLPQSWMREAGIDPAAFLAEPAHNPALATVIARLLAEAQRLYGQADAGIAALPLSCRPGIGAASRLYAAIGQQVARNGHDSITTRAVVAWPRKLHLAARSLAAAPFPVRRQAALPMQAAQALVAAVSAAPPPRAHDRLGMTDRVVWLATLFHQLDRRQARGG